MATAKKSTTTKKATTTSTAPKKPRAPKPIVEEVKVTDPIIETPAIEQPKAKEVPVSKSAPNEKIRVYIPIDPTIADKDGQYIEGSDNGRFFRLKRGQEHFLDKDLAEHVLLRIKAVEELEAKIEATRYKG